MSFRGIRSGLAAVQINGQNQITLFGQLFGLLLDPIVQSPPFVDNNQSGIWARFVWHHQEPARFFFAAWEFHGLRFRRLRADHLHRGNQSESEHRGNELERTVHAEVPPIEANGLL